MIDLIRVITEPRTRLLTFCDHGHLWKAALIIRRRWRYFRVSWERLLVRETLGLVEDLEDQASDSLYTSIINAISSSQGLIKLGDRQSQGPDLP